ncbi:MAG: LysM peptidoglycan-binding domain-containing protein, partial [Planctomycetes bacterium]|nr:LysM peptidoglycan-binding domain-containing protein [Planctomycetota bacterium]
LVLEVGGAQPSLRAALVALGREVDAPIRLRPGGGEPVPEGVRDLVVDPDADRLTEGRRDERERRVDDDQAERDPREDGPAVDDPAPAPGSQWVTVELPKGETLFHIARRYLGNANRYREIMEWNGMTEREASRLQIGHPIRLKRAEMR